MCARFRHATASILLGVCLVAVGVLDPAAARPSHLWYQQLVKLKRQLKALPSDFEKTCYLRQYVGGLLDLGQPDAASKALCRRITLETFDPAEFYPKFRGHTLSAECGITSFFYIKLLQAFGFSAYQYSFGFREQPYKPFIHSVVLVSINFRGEQRLIVQDPYLDLTYLDVNGEPIDFFDFLRALKQRRFDRVTMDASLVRTWLLVPEPAAYYAHMNETCRAMFDAALRREDGSRRTRLRIVRSYASLMQSACGSYEAGFLQAMHENGIDGPFVYSYTLRASDVVGSANSGELQEKIDALLGSRGATASVRR